MTTPNRILCILPRLTLLQWTAHFGGFLPLLLLVYDFWQNNLSINPIQDATQRTGRAAILFLTLSLACTPLNLLGWREPAKIRRALGLYAFFYASLHLLIFTGLDYGFDRHLLIADLATKPYILAGLAAFTILLVLAVTSFQWWMKKLGKHWKTLHQLVYLAAIIALIHYFWAVKGDLLRLRGNIGRPLVFTVIIGILLAMRLPAIRRCLRSVRFPWGGRQPAGKARGGL